VIIPPAVNLGRRGGVPARMQTVLLTNHQGKNRIALGFPNRIAGQSLKWLARKNLVFFRDAWQTGNPSGPVRFEEASFRRLLEFSSLRMRFWIMNSVSRFFDIPTKTMGS